LKRDGNHLDDGIATAALLAGDRVAVARTMSRVERGELAPARVAQALAPHLGRAHVVGLTGAPGAGKSTLVHALLGELLKRGTRIAVVAVDPSSPVSGGAVLGDRVRMGEHGAHPGVFIRSVASRGQLGGLAATTEAMVDVLDAAGFDCVIVETVGAGQSEVDVMRVADTCVVACPPGLGDNVQSIKAGILEIADVLAVTKSDLPGAEGTTRDLRDMLHLRKAGADGAWQVPVVPCASTTGLGVALLVEQVLAHGAARGVGRRLARRVAATDASEHVRRCWAADPHVQAMGIALVAATAGSVTVQLVLEPRHINFNGSCHGGVTFSLADTAFGLAANSHGKIAAGIDTHMTFQQPAVAGDVLTATSVEVSRSRRLAVYRVDVTKGDGKLISSFTGTVYVKD
jgi:LAO/AO transport system kinase